MASNSLVIITGGEQTMKIVTKYSSSGVAETLPDLNVGRRSHACEKFVNSEGVTVSFIYIEL